MADITIELETREVLGFFDSLSKQAPFAISLGLNNLMKYGQKHVQDNLGAHFTLRREQFVKRTVKILRFANKRDLVGVVGIDPERNFLAKFEEGGRKVGQKGMLAVPIAVRRSKSDIILKSMRVRALELRAHRTAKGVVQLKGRHRTFTVKGSTGGAILQRVGRKARGGSLSAEIASGSVRVIYAFKRSVPIEANLHLVQTLTRDAEEWPRFMEAAWEHALATANR